MYLQKRRNLAKCAAEGKTAPALRSSRLMAASSSSAKGNRALWDSATRTWVQVPLLQRLCFLFCSSSLPAPPSEQGKCMKQVQDVIERLWDFIDKLDINTFGEWHADTTKWDAKCLAFSLSNSSIRKVPGWQHRGLRCGVFPHLLDSSQHPCALCGKLICIYISHDAKSWQKAKRLLLCQILKC